MYVCHHRRLHPLYHKVVRVQRLMCQGAQHLGTEYCRMMLFFARRYAQLDMILSPEGTLYEHVAAQNASASPNSGTWIAGPAHRHHKRASWISSSKHSHRPIPMGLLHWSLCLTIQDYPGQLAWTPNCATARVVGVPNPGGFRPMGWQFQRSWADAVDLSVNVFGGAATSPSVMR